MLHALMQYLSNSSAQTAVLVPGAISLAWLAHAARRQSVPPEVVYGWMLSVVVAYLCSNWKFDGELRELYITPVFMIFGAVYLYCGRTMSPACAFSFTFLNLWLVDMLRAYELVALGEVSSTTFFQGVGGAGAGDGLYFFPLAAAGLVVYVKRRQGAGVA